jgi:hypothetical protein
MRANPSTRRLVERLFAEQKGEPAGVDGAVSQVRGAYEKLARAMSPVIADAGLRAMVARGVRKSKPKYPFLDAVVAVDLGEFLDQLWTSLGQQEPPVIKEIGVALLTSFVETLSNLIGDELTSKLFRNGPDASAFASDEPEKS